MATINTAAHGTFRSPVTDLTTLVAAITPPQNSTPNPVRQDSCATPCPSNVVRTSLRMKPRSLRYHLNPTVANGRLCQDTVVPGGSSGTAPGGTVPATRTSIVLVSRAASTPTPATGWNQRLSKNWYDTSPE